MSAAVTVLVPARGDAAFLAVALASLRLQTLAEWQAVVVAVGEAARAAAQTAIGGDSRMRIVDVGEATELEALARTARDVRSEFACVLDGDDALEPDALAQLHAMLAAHPAAGMAYGRHVLVDAGGRMLGPGPLC
ncbi:MAG: glycosyltransferase family 2 protein, partial [Lysobacteraceae bacterium]